MQLLSSQWWSNERMMVYSYFKLMLLICLLMMVKCSSMMVKWAYDPTLIWPSLTSIRPSLASNLVALVWSTPSFAHLTIIGKLHRPKMSVLFFPLKFRIQNSQNLTIYILHPDPFLYYFFFFNLANWLQRQYWEKNCENKIFPRRVSRRLSFFLNITMTFCSRMEALKTEKVAKGLKEIFFFGVV